MPLLRQRPQCLRQEGDRPRLDGDLARLRAEWGPFDADEVAGVQLAEQAEAALVEVVFLEIHLDATGRVEHVREPRLTEEPNCPDQPASHPNGPPFELIEVAEHIGREMGAIEPPRKRL